MRDKKEFFGILKDIDGSSSDAYSQLVGDFDFSRYVLKINSLEHPESGSNLLVVRVPQMIAGFPPHLINTPVRRTALEDFISRRIADEIESMAHFDDTGVARQRLSLAVPGQKMLPRTSMMATEEYIEARVEVMLPVVAGCVEADAAHDIFFEDLPEIVTQAMIYCNLDEEEIEDFVNLMEDADQIRQILPTQGYVSFLASQSMLKREDGRDLPDFEQGEFLDVDESLAVEVDTPNRGTIRGLAIPQGITLIIGGSYSASSDVVNAVSQGIYNHVPGDGRELCVSVPDTVHVVSEPGRSVQRVDLSSFITELPDGQPVDQVSSDDADPFVSQAAHTVESLEIGARVLVFDEQNSSPAFLSGDSTLASLLDEYTSPLRPLSVRARQLTDELGISIVAAGSSAVLPLIPVADQIYQIQGSRMEDVTQKAKAGYTATPDGVEEDPLISRLVERSRWIVPSSLDPSVGPDDARIEALEPDLLEFGRSWIDLEGVTQLADIHQTTTIGRILMYSMTHYLDEGRPIREVLDLIDRDLSTEGLEVLSRDLQGDLARPRRYEIAAALNRLDSLRISHIVD